WFFSNNYIDYNLQDLKKTSSGYTVTIKNPGGFFAPVDMIIRYTDSTTETKHLTPAVWEKDPKQTIVPIVTKKKIESVNLDGGIFMDSDRTNNQALPPKKGF